MESADVPTVEPTVGSDQLDSPQPTVASPGRAKPPPWTRAEDQRRNQRTIELLTQAGDETLSAAERQHCLEQAVELNLPIAESLARRYRTRGEDLDDLIQVARLGLIQAVKRFSPDVGNFAAFAVPTIAGEIKRHFRDHFWSTPRPSRRLQGLHREVVDVWSDVAQEIGHIPTTAQIADRVGARPDEVREAMTATPFNSASLDAPTQTATAVSDGIGAPDPGFEAVEDALERAQLAERLRAAIADLSETDQLILHRRFGQNCKQSVIAAELGISQMSVSRRLTRITEILRDKLTIQPVAVNAPFAAHAGQALRRAVSEQQLTDALSMRKSVGQAVGIVMERYRLTEHQAFSYLVRLSQATNTKIGELATTLIDANDRDAVQSDPVSHALRQNPPRV